MGKMGKKAGKAIKAKSGVTIPPTKKRIVDPKKQGHLRSAKATAMLNVRKTKVVRDKKTGEIIKGSVLDHTDKIPKGKMARIAPDRRWFGPSHVIGQEAMQRFKEEMSKKLADPYSILLKPSKLPLSLIQDPKHDSEAGPKNAMDFKATFGKKATRKRVKLTSESISDLVQQAEKKEESYSDEKDRQLLMNVEKESDPLTRKETGRDMTIDRTPFDKGQSGRIWKQLWKVIDSSDVILQVLDARDPLGTRSKFIEEYLQKEKKFKHLIFILNKVDLVPTWCTARWLQILSKDRPTIAFHASMTNPFGKGNLINLLRQFSRLHGSANKSKKGSKRTISVGLIGYPNVGKSSVVNTLRAKKVCKVAPIPGETKVWQYVNISRSIFLIDCPGVIHDRDHRNNDVQAVLKGVVRVERMGQADKDDVIQTILQIIKPEDLKATYDIGDFSGVDDFLGQIARNRGRLLKGNVEDVDAVAKMVIHDWIRGRLPWFNAPPFESHQQFREHEDKDEKDLLKSIQHYSTFNIINHELKNKVQQEEEGLVADESEDEEEMSEADDVDEVSSAEEEDEEPEPEVKPQKGKKRERAGSSTAAATSWEAVKAASRSKIAKSAKAPAPPAKPSEPAKVRLVRKK